MRRWITVVLLVILIMCGCVKDAQGEPSSENLTSGKNVEEATAPEETTREVQIKNERYVLVEDYREYGDSTVKRNYDYDETGALLQFRLVENSSDGDVSEDLEVYYYNEIGNPERVEFIFDGKVSTIGSFSCDDNRQITCMRLRNEDDEVYCEVFYTYDEYGRKTEMINTQIGYGEQMRKKWTYNQNGDVLLYECSMDGGLSVRQKKYIYGNNGEMTRIEYSSESYNSEPVNQYAEVESDEFGNPTQIIWYDENGEKTGQSMQCSYDGAGNMIQELFFSNGDLQCTATFTYAIIDGEEFQIFGEEKVMFLLWD